MKVGRREFLKKVAGGTVGVGLVWAGATEGGEPEEDGEEYGLTLKAFSLCCAYCGREARDGERYTSHYLCQYDHFGMVLCPECGSRLNEIRDEAITETTQCIVEMEARLHSLNEAAWDACGPVPEWYAAPTHYFTFLWDWEDNPVLLVDGKVATPEEREEYLPYLGDPETIRQNSREAKAHG